MTDEYTNQYRQKTSHFAGLFYNLPFIRAIILNGSLAQGQAKKSSDIDLLIVTKSRRLYTSRFFLIVIGFLTGQKRSKAENKPHAGKFCFNYFLTDKYLEIPTGRGERIDSYCARNYSSSILIRGQEVVFNKFIKANRELFAKYNCSCREMATSRSNINSRNENNLFKKTFEFLLGGKIGDWLEQILKHLQIKMIEKDPRTKRYPDLIVYNNLEARFHPPKTKI